MFTSLNVVRIAAVDCDWTSRSATRWRRRDIGTRCSGRDPSGGWTIGGRAAGCTAGGAADLGASAFASVAAITSPLVIRPPRPEPETSAAARFCSAIILRAAGSAVADELAGAAAAGFARALAGAGAEGAGAADALADAADSDATPSV